MAKVEDDWWPELLRDFGTEDPWAANEVVLAEVRNYEGGDAPGIRKVAAGLVPASQMEVLTAGLADIAYGVDANGPRPSAGRGDYEPRFWLFARGLPGDRCEPFVLSWESSDAVVHLPAPEFLMTYGLVPRTEGGGTIAYDDPRGPTPGVVRVTAPATWDYPTYTPSSVRADRAYVQDYLSLRGMVLVQGFYVQRSGGVDAESAELLGKQDRLEIKLPDRLIDLRRDGDDLNVQVWGGRIVAGPGLLPISIDALDAEGLVWPGVAEPVTRQGAGKVGFQRVFVRDAVLAAYEGKPGFNVHPESGGVSFKGQWSVSYCDRVGRDTIRLELKKLYEGSPDVVVRHWHAFAVPPPQGPGADARTPSIATRARDVVYSMLALGEHLADLAGRCSLHDLSSEDFVRLDRDQLQYVGWWNGENIEPMTRHASLALGQEDFLDRCRYLDRIVGEGIKVAPLRRVLGALGVSKKVLDGHTASLKLLNLQVRLAAVAREQAFQLPSDAERVIELLDAEEAETKPIARLFALNDLRNLGSHREDPKMFATRFRDALERFGVAQEEEGAGYGRILDRIYDGVAEDLTAAYEAVAASAN